MGRRKRSPLLPCNPKASRLFAFVKIAQIGLLTAYLIGIAIWTLYVFTHFKVKIKESKGHIRYKHHSQFFMITGLYIVGSTGFGLWAAIRENLKHCYIFISLTVVGFLFEMVGSAKSNDIEVQELKWLTLIVEPFILLITIIFTRMVNQQIATLIYSPYYRRKMANSPQNSSDEVDSDADDDEIKLVATKSTIDKTQSFTRRKHPFQSFFD